MKISFALKLLLSSTVLVGAMATSASALTIQRLGTYETGIFDEGAAEISAFDPVTQRLFVTNANANTLDILDVSNPNTPSLFRNVDLSPYGGGVNSVAYSNNLFAVAIEALVPQDLGSVVFFDANGDFLNSVTVGALPDMVTFTPDGTRLLVANEGEPNSYNQPDSVDPEGSVSIINISDFSVVNVGFNGVPLLGNVRIYGPNASVAQDLEPEYITVSEDSTRAWVSLQENNALAILNLETNQFEQVVGLGFKDHSLPGNELDASDRDGAINIANWPVFGMYQPDAIAAYTVNGQTYIVTANEGDARDYDGFAEESRVNGLVLDSTAFPNAAQLQANTNLGRLTVTTTLGDANGDGAFEALYALGGRSFSIFDADGNLVFDSGSDFERITAAAFPEFFNSDNAENNFDNRSDNKGPEPEGLVPGKIGDRTYAFIGLERVGGFMIYDVTNPQSPRFIDYINNRNFAGDPEAGTAGDLGPEGLTFISALNSPTGFPLLAITNEVSGSTTLYSIEVDEEPVESVPEPATGLGLLVMGALSWLGLKKRQG